MKCALPGPARPRIGVVACCGHKRAEPCMAQDLYTSPLFRYSRAYVETHCDGWVILSAQHHVVRPGEILAPYDLTLERMAWGERTKWTHICRKQLLELFPEAVFVVLAGSRYRNVFNATMPHEVPLAGMGIGQQVQWLQRQTRR